MTSYMCVCVCVCCCRSTHYYQHHLRHLLCLHAGYVQTPRVPLNFDYVVVNYPPEMDSWADILIPLNHVLMLSFLFMDTEWGEAGHLRDSVELYAGGNSEHDLVWSGDGTLTPLPSIFRTSVVYVHFKSDTSNSLTGFRIMFTFHQVKYSVVRRPAILCHGVSRMHW